MDVVVNITDGNADVVLNIGEVTDAKWAQVEDIVKRKTNIEAENIIVTPIIMNREAAIRKESLPPLNFTKKKKMAHNNNLFPVICIM